LLLLLALLIVIITFLVVVVVVVERAPFSSIPIHHKSKYRKAGFIAYENPD
jgi:hypothetical protein